MTMKSTTFVFVLLCMLLAACGGGASTPTPQVQSATSKNSSVILIPAAPNVQTIPPAAGVTAKIYFPASNYTSSYAAALSGTATTPTNIPAFTGGTPLEYVVFTPTVTGGYYAFPGFVFTAYPGFPAYNAGGFYKLAYYSSADASAGYVDMGYASSVVNTSASTVIAFGSTPGYTPPSTSARKRAAATQSPSPVPSPSATPFVAAQGYNYVWVLYASSVSPTPMPTLAPSTSSMTFANVGAKYAQTLTVSYPNESGAITVTSGNTKVATVSGSGNAPGPVTFTVTPTGAGTTTLTIAGANDAKTTVDVSVSIPSGLTASPSPLTFSTLGAKQTLTVAYPNDAGDTLTVGGGSCVSVNGASSASGTLSSTPLTFTIAITTPTSCTLTISAGNGASITDAVNVTIPQGLFTSTTSLQLYGTGSSYAQTFTAYDFTDSGTIGATSSNPAVATVTPSSGTAPTSNAGITFTVTPVALGSSTITLAAGSHTVKVNVTVNSTEIIGN